MGATLRGDLAKGLVRLGKLLWPASLQIALAVGIACSRFLLESIGAMIWPARVY